MKISLAAAASSSSSFFLSISADKLTITESTKSLSLSLSYSLMTLSLLSRKCLNVGSNQVCRVRSHAHDHFVQIIYILILCTHIIYIILLIFLERDSEKILIFISYSLAGRLSRIRQLQKRLDKKFFESIFSDLIVNKCNAKHVCMCMCM